MSHLPDGKPADRAIIGDWDLAVERAKGGQVDISLQLVEIVPDKQPNELTLPTGILHNLRRRAALIAKATLFHFVLSVSLFVVAFGRQMHMFHDPSAKPAGSSMEGVASFLMSPIALPALTEQEFAYLSSGEVYLAIGLNSLVWGLLLSWLLAQSSWLMAQFLRMSRQSEP